MSTPPRLAGFSAVAACLLAMVLLPAMVSARPPQGPAPITPAQPTGSSASTARSGVTTADAFDLARTAPEAVANGTTTASCTGWRSTFTPPRTIRVLRTKGPATGTVEQVDFHTYVLTVLGAEWQSFYPLEALKAASVSVKQYGWYYTIVYRGGVDSTGACYDVQDNTMDQYYQPELRTPAPIHAAALAVTWSVTLRKYQHKLNTSRFFLTGYRQGVEPLCGTDADGFRLYEHSVFDCAKRLGMTYEQILRRYLDPHLEIVDPGLHDIVGTGNGDVSALVAVDAATFAPRLYREVGPTQLVPPSVGSPSIDRRGLAGFASVDVTGDGFADVITMYATSATSLRLSVAPSDGVAGYGAPTDWWAGDAGRAVGGARLLVGDFNADGRHDAAILLQDAAGPAGPGGVPPARTATLLVMTGKASQSAFNAPVVTWQGALDIASTRAWAADLNGDGRADLLVEQPAGATGVRFLGALSAATGGALGPLVVQVEAPSLSIGHVQAAVGDVNRDGRDDVWLAYPIATGTAVDVLRSSATGTLVRVPFWASTTADKLPYGKLKIESADCNFDGLADLVLFRNGGAAGTDIVTLRTSYTGLKKVATLTDPALDWTAARPY